MKKNMTHFSISIVKSALRITGSIISVILPPMNLMASVLVFAGTYGIAEILGILEEIFDKRKE